MQLRRLSTLSVVDMNHRDQRVLPNRMMRLTSARLFFISTCTRVRTADKVWSALARYVFLYLFLELHDLSLVNSHEPAPAEHLRKTKCKYLC